MLLFCNSNIKSVPAKILLQYAMYWTKNKYHQHILVTKKQKPTLYFSTAFCSLLKKRRCYKSPSYMKANSASVKKSVVKESKRNNFISTHMNRKFCEMSERWRSILICRGRIVSFCLQQNILPFPCMSSYLHRVLIFVRLLVGVLGQEVPWWTSILGSIQLPPPQGQWAIVEAQRQFCKGLVDGVVVLLKVPVVIEVYNRIVVATHCIKLHIWWQTGQKGKYQIRFDKQLLRKQDTLSLKCIFSWGLLKCTLSYLVFRREKLTLV